MSTDRYAHLTGDYYVDREAFPTWQWLGTAALCIIFPPAGFFFLAWLGVGSLTTDPALDEPTDTDTDEEDA